MEESIFPSVIPHKLYSERAILIGTFIGGPLAGGFLLAANFNALSQPAKAGKTWIGVVVLFLVLAGTMFIPALDNVPAMVYSFAFCLTAHSIAKRYQGSHIQLHQANGGQLFSTWRAVVFGAIALAVMVAMILGIAFLEYAMLANQ